MKFKRIKNFICIALCGVMVLASSPLSYATEKEEKTEENKEEKKKTTSLEAATAELQKMQEALKGAKELVNKLKGSEKEAKE